MSATDPTQIAAYPYAWLQPVRYDLDEYRQFVTALDGDLADLVAEQATRRRLASTRTSKLDRKQDSLADSESNLPPGTNCW